MVKYIYIVVLGTWVRDRHVSDSSTFIIVFSLITSRSLAYPECDTINFNDLFLRRGRYRRRALPTAYDTR